jgi:LysR family glycine cleavage system transcriptional activator
MDARRVPRLSLDLLRGFRAAARQLSFTRAAQELFVTQSAISREIRTLEEQLGTPLFKRVNRTLELTEAGRDMFKAVDEALALIDGATERVVKPVQQLAIAITVPLASMWLVPRLPQFTRMHPEVEIRIAASDDLQDLESKRLDVAIRFLMQGVGPPRNAEFLFDPLMFPVLAPALLRRQPLASPADLANHVLLHYDTGGNGRPWVDWRLWFDALRLPETAGRGTQRFGYYDQVVQAAIDGSGVAIGRLPHLAQQLRDGSLVAPLGARGVVVPGRYYVMVAPRAHADLAQDFVAWLREQVGESLIPELVGAGIAAA